MHKPNGNVGGLPGLDTSGLPEEARQGRERDESILARHGGVR